MTSVLKLGQSPTVRAINRNRNPKMIDLAKHSPKLISSEMGSPSEFVEARDSFAAGTKERGHGCKIVEDANLEQKLRQIADEHESLPLHLKRLFLYCSLFPSAYEFRKDELIQLWIAEGFIRERQSERMEDTASEHFNSLEKQGFFVLSRCDFAMDFDSGLSAPTDNLSNFLYKVNPIKRSILEDTISSGNYFRAVDGKLDGASEMTRHLSLICEDIDGMTFGVLQNLKHLRTLHLLSCRGSSIKHVPRDFCFTLTFLRTLNMSGTLISELPSSIGNVKSLRYIDASRTPISRLPESIDSLHSLQTIKLRGCIHFVQLPKGMKKLTNLRHIDLDIIRQLDTMPAHLGNLSNLQTLPAFLVGRDDGCHVGELKNLQDLKGAFNISRLENVLSKEEAERAALIDKKHIHSLELRWSNIFVEYAEQQEKVLECLQPHSGLKELQIQQYSGSILPTWISNPAFADLVVITLYRCRNCKLLPCMGQLPALKFLSIIEMNEVKEINHQFFRNGPVDHAFPKLERLEVGIMLNLKEWKDVQIGDLPSLVKLTVDSCPELVTIPPLSCLKSLKHLEFRRCPKLLSLPTDGLPTSLESFLILDCLQLKEWCLNSEHWSMFCHVRSVWFDNQEGHCGITYQSVLAQVTAEAAEAQSYPQISTEYSSSLPAALSTSLTQLPVYTGKTMEPQEMPSKMPDSAVTVKKSSDISHLDQRSQPSSFAVDNEKRVAPIHTWFLISNSKFAYDLLRRPDGTFNRELAEFLDRKVPANNIPVDGVFSFDQVDRGTNLLQRVYQMAPENHAQWGIVDLEKPLSTTEIVPIIIFFHGGSFTLSSPNSAIYDTLCRRLVNTCKATVVSVHYRRSPEHRYPCAYDDGWATLKWVKSRTWLQSGKDSKVYVYLAGDNSGGNIAHHVAVRAAEAEVEVLGNILLHPMFGGQMRTESEIRLDGKYFVTIQDRDWYWQAFLPEGEDRDHPACNTFGPRDKGLEGLKFPKSLVVVAALDLMQDWQLAYVEVLKSSGQEVKLIFLKEATIGFYFLPNNKHFNYLMEEISNFVNPDC